MHTIKQTASLSSVSNQADMLTEVPVVKQTPAFLQEVIGSGLPEQLLTEKKRKGGKNLDQYYGNEPESFTD